MADQLLEADPSVQLGTIDFGTGPDGEEAELDLGAPSLTRDQSEDALRNLALESISRWQEAGLPEDQLDTLYTASYGVGDLGATAFRPARAAISAWMTMAAGLAGLSAA